MIPPYELVTHHVSFVYWNLILVSSNKSWKRLHCKVYYPRLSSYATKAEAAIAHVNINTEVSNWCIG